MSLSDDYAKMKEQIDAAAQKREAQLMERVDEANRRFFLRECAAEGIDPARGVSPSLLKLLGRRQDSRPGDDHGREKADRD